MLYNPRNSFLRDKLKSKYDLTPDRVSEINALPSRIPLVSQMIRFIINRFFEKQSSIHKSRFEKFLKLSKDYQDNLEGFLKFSALGAETDMVGPNLEQVTLMTLHASKGLEFNCVFIVGCEDGLIPYSLYDKSEIDIDEERRLLYVGMTRAKKVLYLSHSNKRFIFGREFHLPRSPFLDDIEKELVKISETQYKKKGSNEGIQLKLFDI
jgi:superfamily I DNA/RNA helicase